MLLSKSVHSNRVSILGVGTSSAVRRRPQRWDQRANHLSCQRKQDIRNCGRPSPAGKQCLLSCALDIGGSAKSASLDSSWLATVANRNIKDCFIQNSCQSLALLIVSSATHPIY
jgi:hypothetical protein